MTNSPTIRLIGANGSNVKLCACAARISTTSGNSLEIHSQPEDEDKNRKLIGKVLKSGHRSFIEHATFTFAFCNVSALAEQFFIEFRLASFTVKSRRYVDFSKQGYYTPPGMGSECLKVYNEHIGYLFSEYKALHDSGIPLEDARFVLPYCFSSNFYCTVNARELAYILYTIKHGRGKNIPELLDIHDQIVTQIESNFPILLDDPLRFGKDAGREIACRFDYIPTAAHHADVYREGHREGHCAGYREGHCELVSCSDAAESNKLINVSQMLLENGYAGKGHAGHENANNGYGCDLMGKGISPRAIENVSATFILHDISLSGITHLARHRMQSLLVPPFQKVRLDQYIVPLSIAENPGSLRRYKKAFENNAIAASKLRSLAIPVELYLSLSGNTLDAISTMNAREHQLFFSLRCCNRAQWEIRSFANSMLGLLRGTQPDLYSRMGPNCFASGKCPEGKLSCGRQAEVHECFSLIK